MKVGRVLTHWHVREAAAAAEPPPTGLKRQWNVATFSRHKIHGGNNTRTTTSWFKQALESNKFHHTSQQPNESLKDKKASHNILEHKINYRFTNTFQFEV